MLNDFENSIQSLSANDILGELEKSNAYTSPLKVKNFVEKRPISELEFKKGETGLTYHLREQIRHSVAGTLKAFPERVVEVHAYSSLHGRTKSAMNGAKNVATARALAIKSHLLQLGVPASQVQIFPHGYDHDAKERDRVLLYTK